MNSFSNHIKKYQTNKINKNELKKMYKKTATTAATCDNLLRLKTCKPHVKQNKDGKKKATQTSMSGWKW